MVITLRIKSLMLLLLFITNVMSAMESSQQRLASWESPRQRNQVPSAVQDIKQLRFKRGLVTKAGIAMFVLASLLSAYYAVIYPLEAYRASDGRDYIRERKFDYLIDEPFVRYSISFFTGMALYVCADLYRKKLDKEVYEIGTFECLKVAIQSENTQYVQTLVAGDINMQNSGLTPLRISLRENKPAIVRMLLERGADPERGDHSALFDCFDHADLSTFELLLRNKANPNAVCGKSNCCGQTILNYAIAAQRGHFHKSACVQLLMQHGADPRQKNPKDKKDSFHINTSKEIEELLEANKG